MEQPRVDPSDWASRRKHAMSRARELRSRLREADHDQGSSDASSLASKSEMQRQRRSRQLEATQRLLDGHVGGFDLPEPSTGGSVRGKGRSLRKEGHRQKVESDGMQEHKSVRQSAQYNHDEQPVGRRSGTHTHSSGSETHSVISQQHLGRIHKRYQKPSAPNDPLVSTLDSPVRSNQYNHDEGRLRSTHESNGVGGTHKFRPSPTDEVPEHSVRNSLIEKPHNHDEGRLRSTKESNDVGGMHKIRPSHTDEVPEHSVRNSLIAKPHNHDERRIRSTNESNGVGGMHKFRPSPADEVPEHSVRNSLIEKPRGGRGRGRGRRKSPHDSSTSLGELSRSSKSLSHTSAIVKDQMADSRSRSPSTTRINLSSPHQSQSIQAKVDTSESLAAQSYLRSRRVPDYKEGECEKLAILRARLVARRRKRQIMNGKENAKPESSKNIIKSSSSKSKYSNGKRGADARVKSSGKDTPLSLENLDPNDFSARDFQSKPEKQNASPPRTTESNDRHFRHHESDSIMDTSQVSYAQRERGDGDNDPPRTTESNDRHFRHHESDSIMDTSQVSYAQRERGDGDNDDEASVVDIKLIQCDFCKRSFAPKVYEKHFDSDGQPKCVANLDKKRPVFDAAKARIANNSNLKSDEQMQVLQANKKVTKELSRKLQGKGSKRRSKKGGKWREESQNFRDAMRTNRLISKAEKEGKPAHYYL